jgi:uncharacterized protein
VHEQFRDRFTGEEDYAIKIRRVRYRLQFSFNFYRKPDCSSEHDELSLTADETVEGLQRAFRVVERRLPRFGLLSNLSDRADLRTSHLRTYGVGHNYIVIDCDANISECQMDMQHPITTIEAEDPLVLVRADTNGIQNLPVDQRECRECVWRYRCTGGCPRLTWQHTGRYDARSPLCKVYRTILPEVVRLETTRYRWKSVMMEIRSKTANADNQQGF